MSLAAAASSASAVYPLNETSGNAIASVGGQDLTENGTGGIGTGTCFGGAARDFEETENDRFTHADNAVFQSGDIDFTICAQIRMESKTQAYPAIVAKTDSGGTPEYHLIYRASVDTFEFVFGSGTVRSTDFGSPSTATDYLLVAVHRATANELAIYVNGTKTQISYSSGNTATAKGFGVGDEGDYHDGDSGWDGLIREVVILKNYAFSDAEVTELYNSGAPVNYANWTPTGNTATVWLLRA